MTALKPLVVEYGLSVDGTLVLDRERNLAVENASIKNLNVTGTLTAINTTDSLIKDNNILLNSGIEPGAVTAFGSISNAGSNYTQGLYRNIPLVVSSGTAGSGATADITVAINGTVSNVSLVNGGSGYATDTVFTVTAADIDSNTDGANFTVPVSTVGAGVAATDASITVARGTTGADVAIKWDESDDTWKLTRDGSAYSEIIAASDADSSNTANKIVIRDANRDINIDGINTSGTALDIFSGASSASTLTVGGAVTGNILKIHGTTAGESNLTATVTTGTMNVFTGVTGKIQIGTEDTRVYVGDKAAVVSHQTDIAANESGNSHVTDSFKTNEFRSAEYLIHVEAGAEYQVSKVLLTHKGTNPANGATEVNNVYITEYGTITSNTTLATVDADLNGNTASQVARLLITPSTNSITKVRVVRTSIIV